MGTFGQFRGHKRRRGVAFTNSKRQGGEKGQLMLSRLYLVCRNVERGGGRPYTLRLSGILAPDFLQAPAIFSQVPIAQPGSRTDLNPTIRDIKNKKPLIDKAEKCPELDPDLRIVRCDYRGVLAASENSSESVKGGLGISPDCQRFYSMAVDCQAGNAVG
jgi:hypothetical protein